MPLEFCLLFLLKKLADGSSLTDALHEMSHDFDYVLVDGGFPKLSECLDASLVTEPDECLLFETLGSSRKIVESVIKTDRNL